MKMDQTRRIVYAALFLGLCMVLPLLTAQLPQLGKVLSPMHMPVLVCGFLCGSGMGAPVGFVAPLLRHAIFGIPLWDSAVVMALELAAYGGVSGALYRRLPHQRRYLYVALVGAILVGRGVWGVARTVLAGMGKSSFSWSLFVAGGFVNALPGILGQLLLIPPMIRAIEFRR